MAGFKATNSSSLQKLFTEALSLYQSGKLIEAGSVCAGILKSAPKYLPALELQALVSMTEKKFDVAVDLYARIVRINPKHAKAYLNRGIALKALGQIDLAIQNYDKSAALEPKEAAPHFNRANALVQLGKFGDASEGYRKAIILNPRHAESYANLGNVLLELEQVHDAIGKYDKAIEIAPKFSQALYNRGKALHKIGKHEEALASFDSAIGIDGSFFEALNDKGLVLQDVGRYDEALNCYDKAVVLNPNYAETHMNRGNALNGLGRFEEALASYDRAIALKPSLAEAYSNRGNALKGLKQFGEALASFDKAIALKPDFAEAYSSRGDTFREIGELEKTIGDYSKQLNLIGSDDANARKLAEQCLRLISIDSLPAVYSSQKELESSRKRIESTLNAIEQGLGDLGGRNVLMNEVSLHAAFHLNGFYVAYQQKNDRSVMTSISRCLARILGIEAVGQVAGRRRPGPMRFGIAAQKLGNHNGANWAYEWLAQLPGDYEYFTYSLDPERDDLSEKFSKLGRHRELPFGVKSFGRAIKVMRHDNLDFLMLPEVGMTPSSRILSVHRIAPVQFTAWGHPVTTGSAAMDYYLSSDAMEPANAQEHYSEKLIRLPNLALFLRPSNPSPVSEKTFGLPEGRILYGCLQSLFKYIPLYDEILPRIAQEVPNALFIFLDGKPAYMTGVLRQRLAKTFAAFGLDAARHVVFLPRVSSADYLLLLRRMHILIDSVGWSGGNTSLSAIEAGVPLITLPGEFMRGRHTYAMFSMMGVHDLVADSLDGYISKLVDLGRDADLRSHVAAEILNKKDLLYEDLTFVNALDEFLKKTYLTLN
ncbi:MAG TPA: tetratricopeptide repeat protein [Aestuariivirga sp.]|nr:tetratricopeptide repeat protein [Aestuariivirga sp.]